MNKIGLINYGMGNLTSVTNVLEYYNVSYEIINYSDLTFSRAFCGYILPGVGSFNKAMEIIRENKLDEFILKETKEHKKPILGICLGMQLLLEDSLENGYTKGLGLIKGNVIDFKSDKLKIPHVGWNEVSFKDDLLLSGIRHDSDFYFDHSFYVKTEPEYVIGQTNYIKKFPSIIKSDNIYGVQFHPEKSQKFGMKMIQNFAKVCGALDA